MSDIVLHIGLHKTATKYFQHYVFPFLDDRCFLYNPPQLDQYVLDVLKANPEDRPAVETLLKREIDITRRQNPGKTIVLSREALAGNLFNAYKYWNMSISLLKRMFPDAKIILFFRYQPDWLASCYRESIHEHHYQHVKEFLSFDRNEGRFFEPGRSRNDNGFANLNALRLDYCDMLENIYDCFSKDSVSVYFFEHFKEDPDTVLDKLLSDIGSNAIEKKSHLRIPNRGYSALSIALSVERARLLKAMEMESYLHRPIFFYGRGSIPFGNISRSALCKEKYWGEEFLRDNEEVRSTRYPELSSEEVYEYERSWRYVVKNVLDNNDYIDWDVLGDLRAPLDCYYKKINQKLVEVVNEKVIPECYVNITS